MTKITLPPQIWAEMCPNLLADLVHSWAELLEKSPDKLKPIKRFMWWILHCPLTCWKWRGMESCESHTICKFLFQLRAYHKQRVLHNRNNSRRLKTEIKKDGRPERWRVFFLLILLYFFHLLGFSIYMAGHGGCMVEKRQRKKECQWAPFSLDFETLQWLQSC